MNPYYPLKKSTLAELYQIRKRSTLRKYHKTLRFKIGEERYNLRQKEKLNRKIFTRKIYLRRKYGTARYPPIIITHNVILDFK